MRKLSAALCEGNAWRWLRYGDCEGLLKPTDGTRERKSQASLTVTAAPGPLEHGIGRGRHGLCLEARFSKDTEQLRLHASYCHKVLLETCYFNSLARSLTALLSRRLLYLSAHFPLLSPTAVSIPLPPSSTSPPFLHLITLFTFTVNSHHSPWLLNALSPLARARV